MSRPPWMSRGLWFAQRRNRRGRPVTLSTYDELTAWAVALLKADIRIVEGPGLLAAFRKVTHIKPFYVPPLFERREVKP